MRTCFARIAILLAAALCTSLCGCLNLKPVQTNTRYFVLSSCPPSSTAPGEAGASAPREVLGIGPVKLPSYLFKQSFAVRKSPNEIVYQDGAQWAEGLEHGFLRAFAQDLAARLPGNQLRLASWRAEDVSFAVYINVEQFDVDASGRGVLIAWWRIVSPGDEKVIRNGQSRLSRQGASPNTEPSAATATLSQLVAELSDELARAIRAVHASKNPEAADAP